MAGGPLFPFSIVMPATGRVGIGPHVGASNSRSDEGIQVEASLGADSVVELRFQMPPTLPTGTGKLLMNALSVATSGNAKPHVKWASVADAEAPDDVTLNDEGVETVTWSAGNDDDYKFTKRTLDADTLVGGEIVVMHLTFETASWTLASISTWIVSIIWE